MTEKVFPWFPITMELPEQNILWIANAARYFDDKQLVIVDDDYQGRLFDVGAVDVLNDNEMRWRTPTDQPMLLRPTRPDDGESWGHPLSLRIPLPTEIIGGILTHNVDPVSIAAAVDEQGDVQTMILETSVGLYARYSGSWIRMFDISPIEPLNIVNVLPGDLDAYDAADQAGNTINIAYLNPINQPYAAAVDVTPAPTPVAASAVPVMIASVADLPEAIQYAASDEGVEARWYVARRAKALGWAERLPWETEP